MGPGPWPAIVFAGLRNADARGQRLLHPELRAVQRSAPRLQQLMENPASQKVFTLPLGMWPPWNYRVNPLFLQPKVPSRMGPHLPAPATELRRWFRSWWCGADKQAQSSDWGRVEELGEGPAWPMPPTTCGLPCPCLCGAHQGESWSGRNAGAARRCFACSRVCSELDRRRFGFGLRALEARSPASPSAASPSVLRRGNWLRPDSAITGNRAGAHWPLAAAPLSFLNHLARPWPPPPGRSPESPPWRPAGSNPEPRRGDADAKAGRSPGCRVIGGVRPDSVGAGIRNLQGRYHPHIASRRPAPRGRF